jgi:hypothetical protein
MNLKFATVLAVVVALLSGWLLVTVAGTMPVAESEALIDTPAPAENGAADFDGTVSAAVEIQEPITASVEVE